MMRQYELVERVQRYNPGADEDLLNKAYVYAMRAHGAQKRASGDPYFSHPLEVAAILTEHRLDDATIVAALLHDTVEDTDATLDDIKTRFGGEIAQLVEGLTKIKRLDLVSKKAAQAENLRKMLLAVAQDIRVLLVKFADRLHNMRTLNFVPDEKRARIAEETMDIYAPLAGRMGMQEMRDELEDLSFRWLNAEAYATITARLDWQRDFFAEIIAETEHGLTEQLNGNGIPAVVSGRAKRAYSVWRKMERRSMSLEQLSDVLGFRCVVDTIEQCYRTLGVIHCRWKVVPGRFKDYISTPKANDYRSIHTTVIGPGHQRVELQIRTSEMHEVAEYGVAAHAIYKDDGEADGDDASGGEASGRARITDTRAYQWLRELVEMIEAGDSPEDFLEHTKLELFQDQVFCFTPKGRVIALPRGATAIDFAYAVHTDVGNSTVGCKINGRMAPLMSQIESGDEVEVVRSEKAVPPAAWEAIVVTGKARAAIRRATRESVRRQYAELGREILVRIFRRHDVKYSDDSVERVLGRLARSDLNEVLVAVGRGEMEPELIVRAVAPNHPAPRRNGAWASEDGWFGLRRGMGLKFRFPGRGNGRTADTGALPIRGIRSDLPIRFDDNARAVPGDRIVGIMTPGEGITIYPIHAADLRQFESEPDRWLDIRWDMEGTLGEHYMAQIHLSALNEPGTLAQIATVISDNDGNIDNLKMVGQTKDYREMLIDLEVVDLAHLNKIISELREKRVVNRVQRMSG